MDINKKSIIDRMKKRAICTIILCIILINVLFVLSLMSKLTIPIEEEYNITSEYKDFYPYALRGVIIENCDTIVPGIYLKATGAPIESIYFSPLFIFDKRAEFAEEFPIWDNSLFAIRPYVKYGKQDGKTYLYDILNPMCYSEPTVL